MPYGGGYTYNQFLEKRQEEVFDGTSLKYYMPNCIGLVFFSSLWIDYGTLEITGDGNKRSVVYVAEKIAEYARNNASLSHIIDAQYLKCGLDSSETFDLKGNQYLVAIRVGKGQGEGKIDLHGIVQLNDGSWIDKHGYQYNINKLGYIDPDDDNLICWKSEEYTDEISGNEDEGYCYYSETAYIIVTTNE